MKCKREKYKKHGIKTNIYIFRKYFADRRLDQRVNTLTHSEVESLKIGLSFLFKPRSKFESLSLGFSIPVNSKLWLLYDRAFQFLFAVAVCCRVQCHSQERTAIQKQSYFPVVFLQISEIETFFIFFKMKKKRNKISVKQSIAG